MHNFFCENWVHIILIAELSNMLLLSIYKTLGSKLHKLIAVCMNLGISWVQKTHRSFHMFCGFWFHSQQMWEYMHTQKKGSAAECHLKMSEVFFDLYSSQVFSLKQSITDRRQTVDCYLRGNAQRIWLWKAWILWWTACVLSACIVQGFVRQTNGPQVIPSFSCSEKELAAIGDCKHESPG